MTTRSLHRLESSVYIKSCYIIVASPFISFFKFLLYFINDSQIYVSQLPFVCNILAYKSIVFSASPLAWAIEISFWLGASMVFMAQGLRKAGEGPVSISI